MLCSHNDLDVLQRSPLFAKFVAADNVHCNYVVNDNEYMMGYYLVGGTYTSWSQLWRKSIVLKAKRNLTLQPCKNLLKKDVERTFGVLQRHFAIGCGFSCWIFWYIIRFFPTSYAKVIAVLHFPYTFCKTCPNLSFQIFLTSRCSNITTSRKILFFEVFIIFFWFFQNWNGDTKGGRVWKLPYSAGLCLQPGL